MMKVLLAFWSIALFAAFTTASIVEDSADETQSETFSREKRQACPTVTFPCSRMPNVCANMRRAISLGKPTRLNRITNRIRVAKNRYYSGCRRLVRKPGYNCDEYPFASTAQGGRGAVVRNVPIRQNSIQGGLLAVFYRRYNIGNGSCFRVALGP